jgi:transposase
VLTFELDSDEKKLAFENTDGMKGIKEIAQACGAPQDTVYGWWKKWSRLGILEPSESREGRLVKICSLEDLGIKIPKLVHPKEKTIPAQVSAADGITKDNTAETKETRDEKSQEGMQT